MKESDPAEIIDIGVDWLTATCDDPKSGRKLAALALDWLDAERAAGNRLSPWGMAGFQGWCCGRVQTGEGNRRMIVRLTSGLAQRHWREVYLLSTNVSRIDLQVTVRYGVEASRIISRVYRRVKRSGSNDGKKRTLSLYHSSDGSSTIYLGQRVSENYGRIYAKGKETPLPFWQGSVRYEFEAKGDQSKHECKLLHSARSEQDHIIARCLTWFHQRGVDLKIPAAGFDRKQVEYLYKRSPDSLDSSRYLSDADRSLKWLAHACSGQVRWLIESGRMHDVLQALNIPMPQLGPVVQGDETLTVH